MFPFLPFLGSHLCVLWCYPTEATLALSALNKLSPTGYIRNWIIMRIKLLSGGKRHENKNKRYWIMKWKDKGLIKTDEWGTAGNWCVPLRRERQQEERLMLEKSTAQRKVMFFHIFINLFSKWPSVYFQE